MRGYELQFNVVLKKTVMIKDVYEELSAAINKILAFEPDLKALHERMGFKYYVFSGLYPAIKNMPYEEGCTYSFKLRSLDKSFIFKLRKTAPHIINDLFTIKSIDYILLPQRYIDTLVSISPSVATFTNEDGVVRHWTTNGEYGFDDIKNRINQNTIRKFESYFNEKLPKEITFISGITRTNSMPIILNYKNGKIFGNKFIINIKDDSISQQLAFTAFCCGLLEKNAIGMGFLTVGK